MVRDFLMDVTSAAITKSLDCAGIRHRVIADNLANVETPGFKRSDVSFESQLELALKGGDDDSTVDRIKNIEPGIEEDSVSPGRLDGNNVSVDKEMAGMAKNTLQYEALVQLMNLRGSMMRAAIYEGKK